MNSKPTCRLTNRLPGGPPVLPAWPRPDTCICIPSSTPAGILISTVLPANYRGISGYDHAKRRINMPIAQPALFS